MSAQLETPPVAAERARSQWRVVARRFRRHRLAMAGTVVLLLLIVCCFGAGVIAPYPQNEQDLLVGAVGPGTDGHLLGTDNLGRDFLSELLYAGRISLSIGLAVAVLSTLIGTLLGALAGYLGGWVEELIMRIVDLFLIVPAIAVLALALRGLGSSPLTIILVLSAIGWTSIARVARSQVVSLREKEFIEASKLLGASTTRIIVRHMLPNLAGVIAVNVSLAVAAAIIVESTLSFLGFGVQPPQSSWGQLLSDAAGLLGTDQTYLLIFPGVFILVTVLCVNFIGDGLRDAFDQRARRR
ncbi:ABC transporter permease [Conexibacter stalactiti]|uniref:ABC transporter permease n=1 Tax=Conexibacter stalactiti TaxID=1940611 RepID=A0ABU4HP46_9ACTN|nr:ABC transporter permease [Conexibacter stalactiti]MDW5595020.1 ABC transporter permease [Conexibacter stalactiti]MEC5035662.1 ABC transporter permease [Conexibacter stalactiti]